jgi:hypothetical protein
MNITRKVLEDILSKERQLLTSNIEKIVWTAIPRLAPIILGSSRQDLHFKKGIEGLKSSLDQKCGEVALLRAQITELSIQLREMEQQLNVFREQQPVPLALRPDDAEMNEATITENVARISLIITEVGHTPYPELARKAAQKTEVYEKVMAKMGRDRSSSESDIYRRNYCLMLHLTRLKPYSKEAKNILTDWWKRFSVSGDIVAFSGRMFDRDYLNPRSDKFFKYVTFLVFLQKYQRLSQPVTKNRETCDSEEYFWRHW